MIHSVYIVGWKYNEAKQLKQWQTEMVTAKAGTSVIVTNLWHLLTKEVQF